jgi:hypothetical protein
MSSKSTQYDYRKLPITFAICTLFVPGNAEVSLCIQFLAHIMYHSVCCVCKRFDLGSLEQHSWAGQTCEAVETD